jgi:branched-chain amino acid transport system substrate-binding protein
MPKLLVVDHLPDSDPQKAVIKTYQSQYRAAFDTEANYYGGHAWDAFNMAVQAMSKVGPDRSAVRDELEQIQGFVGVNSIFNMSPTDHCGFSVESLAAGQVVNGEWTLVETE